MTLSILARPAMRTPIRLTLSAFFALVVLLFSGTSHANAVTTASDTPVSNGGGGSFGSSDTPPTFGGGGSFGSSQNDTLPAGASAPSTPNIQTDAASSNVVLAIAGSVPGTTVDPAAASAPAATYTVVRGDTSSEIAAAHGMSLAQFGASNPQIANLGMIYVGQVVNVSGSGGSAPAPAPSGNSVGDQVVAFARAQLGKPYVYGGNGPNSYDCSGLSKAAYASAGINIARRAADQYRTLQHVSMDSLQLGDLVFFYMDENGPGTGAGHVGIYIGDGNVIHAPQPGDVVKITPIKYMPLVGAARP